MAKQNFDLEQSQKIKKTVTSHHNMYWNVKQVIKYVTKNYGSKLDISSVY